MQTRQFNLTESSVMKVEMDESGECFYFARDIMPYDDDLYIVWHLYGTDLQQLIETHGSSSDRMDIIDDTLSLYIKISQWLKGEAIDETEMTEDERESEAEDHYFESKHDCEKEAQSWINN